MPGLVADFRQCGNTEFECIGYDRAPTGPDVICGDVAHHLPLRGDGMAFAKSAD